MKKPRPLYKKGAGLFIICPPNTPWHATGMRRNADDKPRRRRGE
jgi:hypothetical protein